VGLISPTVTQCCGGNYTGGALSWVPLGGLGYPRSQAQAGRPSAPRSDRSPGGGRGAIGDCAVA
jgi:hypothetical protein